MAPPDNRAAHPQALVNLFLEAGDGPAALEVLSTWQRREPNHPVIGALETHARSLGGSPPQPIPPDDALARGLIDRGYLEEALILYRRLARSPAADPQVHDMVEQLGAFLDYVHPIDAPRLQLDAEAQIQQGRLTVALAMYHELCEQAPQLTDAARRHDALAQLVGASQVRARSGSQRESNTFSGAPTGEIEVHSPVKKRRYPAVTERDIPVRTSSLEEVPDALDLDDDDGDPWIDPLEDTQQLNPDALSNTDGEQPHQSMAQTLLATPDQLPPQPPAAAEELPEDERPTEPPAADDLQLDNDRQGVLIRRIVVIK